MVQSEGFLGILLSPLLKAGLPLMKSVIQPLTKGVLIFFSISVFFYKHSRITGLQRKGGGVSLTPHYHFFPLYRHLDISQAITAQSLNREPLISEPKSLTTKLCTLKCFNFIRIKSSSISSTIMQE